MKDIVNEENVNFRVGVLSTIDSPLLPFFLESILGQKMKNIVVICDSKKIASKDKKIFFERTGGEFERFDDRNSKGIFGHSWTSGKVPSGVQFIIIVFSSITFLLNSL